METQPSTNARVLIADSDIVQSVSARRALQERGFAVTIAHDGAEAVELYACGQFDAALIGMNLRIKDGLQVLRELQAGCADAVIVLMHTEKNADLATLGVRQGAFSALKTPFEDWDSLAETLTQAISARRVRDQVDPIDHNLAARVESPAVVPDPAPVNDSEAFALLRLISDMTRNVRPLDETLDLLLQATAQILETAHASVLLVDHDQLKMHRALGARDLATAAREFANQPGEEFAWRVVNERRTLIQPLPARLQRYVIGAPLIARDEVLGIVVAYPLANETLAPERARWIELFAAHGAIALELEHLASEYEQLAPTETITGTLKRSIFMDLADREFRRSWRYNQPIAAIVIGLDNLAEIKNAYNLAARIQVLELVAQTCRSTIRSIDLVCNYEDDTFALLLLMATQDDARHVAERLRKRITTISLAEGEGPTRISVSLGACAYPRDGCASIFDLIALAQEAQRAARRSGSNQIVYI